MIMKFKHNKRKNSAFLYEVLIQELAKTVVSKDKNLRIQILKILKENFSKNTTIGKELKIFKAILNAKNVNELIGEKIINEAKKEYSLLDKEKLFKEQNELFFKIKKILNPQVFSNFIPNYKDLASISQIFNKDVSIKTRVLLETELIKKMSSNILKEDKMVPIDNIIMNSFVKKFNEKYQNLFEEQKKLLNKFITSFVDNGIDLKVFLNEEIARLKKELSQSMTAKELTEDKNMLENCNIVLKILEGLAGRKIDEEMISQVIKIQNLLREIKS